jgi:hypothetical protein
MVSSFNVYPCLISIYIRSRGIHTSAPLQRIAIRISHSRTYCTAVARAVLCGIVASLYSFSLFSFSLYSILTYSLSVFDTLHRFRLVGCSKESNIKMSTYCNTYMPQSDVLGCRGTFGVMSGIEWWLNSVSSLAFCPYSTRRYSLKIYPTSRRFFSSFCS